MSFLIDALKAKLRSPYAAACEGIQNTRLRGWAVDRPNPAKRVPIGVSRGDGEIRWFCADWFRADVQNAGFSPDGYCGFDLPLSFFEGQGSYSLFLGNSKRTWQVLTPPAATPSQYKTAQGLCFHVAREGSNVFGWVLDRSDFSARRTVRLESAGQAPVQIRACLFDKRSQAVEGADGFHGFRLRAPSGVAALYDASSGTRLIAWP